MFRIARLVVGDDMKRDQVAMRICIFGRDDDAISRHTEQVALARGHDVLRVAFSSMQSGAAVAFDGSSWLFQGEDLAACDGYVLRQYPAAHALLAPPDEQLNGAEWYRRAMQQVERSTFAQSAIMQAELSGKPMVNPLLAMSPYEHKPLQLATFHRAHLPIPRTVITNFPDAVRIFMADVAQLGSAVISKPVAGGAETILVDDDVCARLDSIKPAPVIFQERALGPDVRVTVVHQRVVSAVVVHSEDGVDYRRGDAYRSGDARYTPHALPHDVEEMSVRAAGLCHHVLSGIDWKLTKDGYVLLEANSAPVYLDIEHKTGAPITQAVVEYLESAARAH